MNAKPQLLLIVFLLAVAGSAANAATITVRADQTGAAINRGMWGIFFEDINFGADGGLYAELVKNRSFEFPEPLMGWSQLSPKHTQGSVTVRSEEPLNARNPHYLRIESKDTLFGIANEGFRGIGVKRGEAYNFSAQIRQIGADIKIRVELYGSGGLRLDSVRLDKFSTQWAEYTAILRPCATDPHAKLYVLLDGPGTVDLDMVSLFPQNTWKQRPRGLRADMVQRLADLKPGFMRFPGGCVVEGVRLANRYQWKQTIGPVSERPTMLNRWNDEFLHRSTPDYYQSLGLGFFEYFQLCEDIGAEPLPILSCGLACQFNSGEACPLDQLQPYIQDALDLVEFANGPADSAWGAKRAAMGHPAPFHLKMIGVGNENWEHPYIDRYAKFHAALKAKYPDIQLVSSAGPGPDDKHFHYAWPKLRELNADIVDEHCYARPDWFYKAVTRYDGYDRKGPKVFFGEYAAQSDRTVSVLNRNNLDCALAEAACMTGLERNGDVVRMASYAPLFAHVDAWQWRPDLIWVDNLTTQVTPSYYVQQMFANNPGDQTVPFTLDAGGAEKFHVSVTRDLRAGELVIKVVNGGSSAVQAELSVPGLKSADAEARVITLAGSSPSDENSFSEPEKVSPKASTLVIGGPRFNHVFPANSLSVLRVKTGS